METLLSQTEKTNLKTKTVCVVDGGLFVSFARKIAPGFKKVYYHTPWKSYAPTTRGMSVGDGFEDIERLEFPLGKADEIDLWVFLDLFSWDLQEYLISKGARVWGARRGEEMELYRWEFKKALKKLGLPVQPVECILGVDELRKVLKTKKDVFIKNSFTRGDFETFHHKSYVLSEPHLDELEYLLGPTKADYEFIVEDNIPDAVEVGYDGFTIDGKFPSHAMMAYEVKDVGMIGTVKKYSDIAKPVTQVNSALSGVLESYNYRGFLCTEIRYGRDKKPYLIDPCCRLGTPSNELLQELFEGWPETLWYGAVGEMVSPVPKFQFGVLAVIHSEFAVDNWQAFHYPKEIDKWVKLRFHSRIEGVDYTVPQPVGNPCPGVVCGVGNTLLEAVKQCKAHAAEISGYQVKISLDSIETALDTIKEGEKAGIMFATKLPTAEELKKA